MPASITTFMKWAINTAGGTLPATQLIDNVSGRIGVRQEIVDTSGQNASLTGRTNRMRVVSLPAEPTFNMEPTALELTYLFPWLLGAAGVGTIPILYTPNNALLLRGVQGVEDRGSDYPHNFTNLAVDSFTIRSQPGRLVGLEIQAVTNGGVYENTTAFPVLANFDNVTSPFAFPDLTGDGASGLDGAFTIGGTTRQAFSATFSVNFGLDRGRMPHTLSPTGLRKRTQEPTIQFQMPADEAQAIYAADLKGITPRAVVMRWRNPVQTTEYLEINCPSVVFPLPELDLPVRDEVRPIVTGMVKYDGTNPPFTISLQIRT